MTASFAVRLLLDAAPASAPTLSGLAIASAPSLDEASRASAVKRAWYWPEAEEVLAKTAAGLRIALEKAPEDDLEHAVELTRLAAELGQKVGAKAYVWEATGLAHDAVAFTDQASDASVEDLPLYLWIGFEARQNDDDSLAVFTRGMATFERPEVEIDRTTRELEDALEVVTDAALYVLTAEQALEDGEQLEVTRGKVRVRIAPSIHNDGTKVVRLRLP